MEIGLFARFQASAQADHWPQALQAVRARCISPLQSALQAADFLRQPGV